MRSDDRSPPFARTCWSRPFQMVGTAPARVVGHDQIRAGHDGRVRESPGVGMEHGYDRQHPVPLRHAERVAHAHAHRVQIRRAVAVYDTLGQAGGATGVAHRGGRALLQIWPAERLAGGRQQLLIGVHLHTRVSQLLRVAGQRLGRPGHQHVAHRLGLREHLRQQRNQGAVTDDHVVGGVVGDIAELAGIEPQVQRVQHRAHGRDREVGLQMLGVVPEQGRDPLVAVHSQHPQRIGEPGRPGPGLGIGLPAGALARPGDHFTAAERRRPVPHDPGYGQRRIHHRAAHGHPPCRPRAGLPPRHA